MEIEICESLIESYLKLEKKCFIVQKNWKPAKLWENDEQIKENRNIAEKRFSELVQNPKIAAIFKKESLDKLMQQAELDVIGICNNKIYLVEAAFHEGGMFYDDNKNSTAAKVFGKLLRAYFIHLIYFPQCEYECIFATPKAGETTNKSVKEILEVLNNEVEKQKFIYISNDEFSREIIEPILKKSKNEKNLSDPFLRYFQMLKRCKYDVVKK